MKNKLTYIQRVDAEWFCYKNPSLDKTFEVFLDDDARTYTYSGEDAKYYDIRIKQTDSKQKSIKILEFE